MRFRLSCLALVLFYVFPASVLGTEEVVISGQRDGGPTEISEQASKLMDVPGALGDPVAAAFSLPGVVYSAGDSGEPAVRGSSPDDNLFIVDFLPAGYVFHAFTNSVFSENIVRDFQLKPAGFGAEYSDVTGAVFDIALRTPRNQSLRSVVDVSMLRSGVFLEGGVTDNSAAYLSIRKSLMHLFMSTDQENDGVRLTRAPEDNDYQFKYALDLSGSQSLTLAANGASDLAGADFLASSDDVQANPDFAGNAKIKNRFRNRSLTWDLGDATGPRLKIAAGQARQDVTTRWGTGYFDTEYLDRSLLKLRYDQPMGGGHALQLDAELSRNEHGANYDLVLFVCNEFDPLCTDDRRGRVTGGQTIHETARAFALADRWRMTDDIDLTLGAQMQSNTYTGERFVNPRGALRWTLADRWTLDLKAGDYNRFPDLEAVLPQLGNPKLNSPRARHFAMGLSHQIDAAWSWSGEVYYKKLAELPLALSPTEPDASLLYSNDVRGQAYGLDLMIDKKRTDLDKWYGWLALSLARSERTNERTGVTRPYRLDTPLIANWVMNYQFAPRFSAGFRLTLRSGQATTPIVGVRENPDFAGYVQPVYGEPFSDRLPLYGRLDLRFKYDFHLAGYESAWILDVINATNQRNVASRHLDYVRSQAEGRPYVVDDVGNEFFPALTFRITF
jgi:hypothetical protein